MIHSSQLFNFCSILCVSLMLMSSGLFAQEVEILTNNNDSEKIRFRLLADDPDIYSKWHANLGVCGSIYSRNMNAGLVLLGGYRVNDRIDLNADLNIQRSFIVFGGMEKGKLFSTGGTIDMSYYISKYQDKKSTRLVLKSKGNVDYITNRDIKRNISDGFVAGVEWVSRATSTDDVSFGNTTSPNYSGLVYNGIHLRIGAEKRWDNFYIKEVDDIISADLYSLRLYLVGVVAVNQNSILSQYSAGADIEVSDEGLDIEYRRFGVIAGISVLQNTYKETGRYQLKLEGGVVPSYKFVSVKETIYLAAGITYGFGSDLVRSYDRSVKK